MIRFIIPSYNEEQNLKRCVNDILAESKRLGEECDILIVDDGSTDGTRALVERLATGGARIRAASHPRNMGVGQAFRTGFAEIMKTAQDGDVMITKEADNTGDPAITGELVRRVRAGDGLVLASCYAAGGAVKGSNRFRKILSTVANALVKNITGIEGIHTYSSFYRAYDPKLVRKALEKYGDGFIREDGFICMVEMLVKFRTLTDRITEVPMVLKCDLRMGKSKMKVARNIADYLRYLGKVALLGA
jgi:dolichol-phosphate mannosyltransferase